ncbi:MAG: hypothetical protein Q9213_002548 [Squamulea squamosa]
MFQCLGLAGEKDGGCGEDWWHPECILGLGWNRPRTKKTEPVLEPTHDSSGTGQEPTADQRDEEDHEDEELPPGFPAENDFETFICYKCVDANPWIKRYASSTGFLPPVRKGTLDNPFELDKGEQPAETQVQAVLRPDVADDTPGGSNTVPLPDVNLISNPPSVSLKRRVEDNEESHDPTRSKKAKIETNPNCYYESLPKAIPETFSLFLKDDFRDHFCRCANCYPNLRVHPQLLEEEESYEPPLSEEDENARGSVGTGSLLDRGEAALNNVDRVRAIEGVMVYNHLKDKVKSFLQPFAESGQAVGAEDIKAYFEKLRGDEQAMKSAVTVGSAGNGDGDNRREQSGKLSAALTPVAQADGVAV